LAERRRTRRRRGIALFIILLLLLLAAAVYGLWQRAVRISHVNASDAAFAEYATSEMRGSYFGIIPRDSIFFFPEERIRADILASRSDIAAVSIFRNGFTGLSIKVDKRVPVARWCVSPDGDCYIFDTDGFIYATSTDVQPVNSFTMFESLVDSTGSPQVGTTSPIGATLPNADKLPAAFDFARHLDTFGSPVVSVAIHDGEVDDHLASGTRVTYVLGREQDAFTALVSARDNFNLSDGSVDYVDLRFDGKVYLKKK